MQHTLEFPTRSSILPNLSLNDPEALEQTLALQTLVAILLTLKGLTSFRGYKPGRQKSWNGACPGGLCVLGHDNIGRGLLDIHYKRTTPETSIQIDDSETEEE
jgi:hypothetical protein